MRHRPLGIGLDWQGLPLRVFAPQRRSDECMGLFLGFLTDPTCLCVQSFVQEVIGTIEIVTQSRHNVFQPDQINVLKWWN